MTNWGNDPKVKKFNQLKKDKAQALIHSVFFMVAGTLLYLVGWWMVGLPQFLIALGIPLILVGVAAFYGQAVSEVSINSKS